MADAVIVGKNTVQSAIDAGTALARPITNPNPESRAAVLVPPGSSLEYLEREDKPPRHKGTALMNDAASFIAYWAELHTGHSRIYGRMSPLQFTAVFNDSITEQTDWRDHRCVYAPTHSKEWLAWNQQNRKKFDGNESFAIWLEDNATDVVKPDPAKMMDIALNMKVNQIEGFANAVRLADGNIQLTYTNQVDASARTSSGGKLAIPELFTIEIPVFEGINAKRYKVDARFRYRLSSGALSIHYELVRPHKVIEEAFSDLVDQIGNATKETVLFGSPE